MPLRLAVLAVAVALLLAAVWMQTRRPLPVSNAVNLAQEPRHPVTPAMEEGSKEIADRTAQDATLQNGKGEPTALSSFWESRPAVVVFTKDGCPCSLESQSFFNLLAVHYKGRADFVAVMDAKPAVASKYEEDLKLPYPVLSTKDDSVFRSFAAERSVYVTLIEKGGRIAKQWPGYSSSMLRELDQRLAVLCGGSSSGLTFDDAPEKATSGCKLFRPVGE